MGILTHSNTTSSKDYNRLNLQVEFIFDIAELIDSIDNNISRACSGSIHSYRVVLGDLVVLRDKLIGTKLKMDERDIKLIDLHIKIADALSNIDLREGLDNLRNAYIILLEIMRLNNLIFPKKIRSFGFKDFTIEEIG